jgi:hypothetical protein
MAGLGLYKSLVRVVVQLPITASKITSPHFRKAADKSDAVRNLCINFNEVLLSQARITAACNAVHLIEARFCRWLLQSADRAASNTLTLTQELLAEMLGVRRTSVTEVASKIQGSGAISYSRGVIKILDRPAFGITGLRVLPNAFESTSRADLARRPVRAIPSASGSTTAPRGLHASSPAGLRHCVS